jgi:hypothetical protein
MSATESGPGLPCIQYKGVNARSNGIDPLPEDIVAWLDKLAKAHAKVAIPQNYKASTAGES